VKILLDECVPLPLREILDRHTCQIRILELSTNKLRLIEAAASQIKEAVDSIGPTEFRRLEIPKAV
jgi:hypothetical protein